MLTLSFTFFFLNMKKLQIVCRRLILLISKVKVKNLMWFLIIWQLSLVSNNAANPLFLPTPTHKPTPPLSPKQRQPPPGTLSAKAGSREYVSDLGSEPGKLWLVRFIASRSLCSPFCSFTCGV